MTMTIMHNDASMTTLGILNKNSSSLAKDLKKVSSGMKLTSAGDDASGYAISERMRAQIRSLAQDTRNTQNGTALLKVAEGAVSSTVDILRTLKAKAIDAANDTNTDTDRATLQKELDQSADQIDDNALVTFNGKYLVDGSHNRKISATKTARTNEMLSTSTTGTTAFTDMADRNGQSLAIQSSDTVTMSWVKQGETHSVSVDGTGTIEDLIAKANSNSITTTTETITTYTVNGVSTTDKNKIFTGQFSMGQNGEYTSAGINAITTSLKDFVNTFTGENLLGDNIYPVMERGKSVYIRGTGLKPISSLAKTYLVGSTAENAAYTNTQYLWIWKGKDPDSDNDIYDFLVTFTAYDSNQQYIHMDWGGNTGPLDVIPWNKDYPGIEWALDPIDEKTETVTKTEGEETFEATTRNGSELGDDGSGNIVTTAEGKNAVTITADPDGLDGQVAGLTFCVTDSEGNVKRAATEKLNAFDESIRAENASEDHALVIHTGTRANQNVKVHLTDMRSEALGLKSSTGKTISIGTQAQANAAINVLDTAVQKALDEQTRIGAYESRLDFTTQNLTTAEENVRASESTIRDADMAKEMTSYMKESVLLQASQSMLAQSNQTSSNVLSLLQ